jgi:hypothetical protein
MIIAKWEILTIELNGMDACACEDAYERMAHLDIHIYIFKNSSA